VWLYKATSDVKFLGDAVDHLQVGFGRLRCSLRRLFSVKLRWQRRPEFRERMGQEWGTYVGLF
jgi:hypothetical protein